MTSRISRFRQKMQEAAKCHREEGNGGTFDFDIRENRIPLQLAEEQIELRNAGMLEELSPEVAAIPLRLAPEQKELRRSIKRSMKAEPGQAGETVTGGEADKEKAEWLESLQAVWQKPQGICRTVHFHRILFFQFSSAMSPPYSSAIRFQSL